MPGPAKWGAQVPHKPAVEPYHTGVNAGCKAVRPFEVFCPDRGRKAIFRGIDQPQSFLLVLERLKGRHGAKNFFPVGHTGVVQAFDEGGLNEEAALQSRLSRLVAATAAKDAATFSTGCVNSGEHFVAVPP